MIEINNKKGMSNIYQNGDCTLQKGAKDFRNNPENDRENKKNGVPDTRSEHGRSMVEMLGALAIIGLLGVTGVLGYQHAMNIYRANETIREINQRAVIYSQQLLSGNEELSSQEFDPAHETRLGYPLEPSLIENQPFFKIELMSVPKAVCQNIVNADWYVPAALYVNGHPDDGDGVDCPIKENTMAFYFYRDLAEHNETGFIPEEPPMNICRSNSDCIRSPDGPVCDTDTGKCGPCSSNEDCTDINRPICNLETGFCEKCTSDADCAVFPDKPYCETTRGQCVECLTNDHCEDRTDGRIICHKEKGTCAPCEVDADCPTGEVCDQTQEIPMCIPMPSVQIEDVNGNTHDCNSIKIINVSNKESECDKCANREIVRNGKTAYCVETCRKGEFLASAGSGNGKCVACSSTEATYVYGGARAFCNVCPERYSFESSWGNGLKCYIKDCGTGYVPGMWGCSSCSDKRAIQITTWYSSSSPTSWGKKACLACDPKRRVEGGYCVLDECTDTEFRYNNNCTACNSTSSFDISNATNREACLGCKDADGNPMRRIQDKYCILASQCPYGTQEDDPSTSDIDESEFCAPCPENTFSYQNKCIPCDDDAAYDVLKASCAMCNGKRQMVTIPNGSGGGNVTRCMRVKKDGEFYSSLGTQSCLIEKAAVAYTRPGICAACGDDRTIAAGGDIGTYGYYCIRTCPEKGTMLTIDGCIPCDYNAPVSIASTHAHVAENSGIVLTTDRDTCSAVCPGQRYRRADYDNSCMKCPSGTFSIGDDATNCSGNCDTDQITTEGACIACGRTWSNGSCGGGCAEGEYLNNGVCTTCPSDLSGLSGTINEQLCTTCGGTWNNKDYFCCPTSKENITTKAGCEQCDGTWDSVTNTCS